MTKIKKFLVAMLALSFIVTPNFVGATVTTDSSSTGYVNSISLTANGTNVSWTLDGYSPKGFKVVWSKNQNPTYPLRSGDKYLYLSDPDSRSGTLTAFDGSGTYYVRVCEYLGGKCGVYSNQTVVSLGDGSDTPASGVDSITLSGNTANVSWSVDGYSSKGFKVVWSKNQNPTYPLRSGDKYNYHTDSDMDHSTLTAFAGAGTYYVRVCEYLGGSCGVYSNQITVTLGDTSAYVSDDVNSITLTGSGKNVNWIVNGHSDQGFKVVWSKNSNPTYPTRSGDKYHYYNDAYRTYDTLEAFSGNGDYYVRVCEYLGGKCGVYSNQIKVALGSADTSGDSVDSITLKSNGKNLTWTVNGYSPKGFKVVWSKNSNPTYPTRSGDKYHYLTNPDVRTDTLNAFSGHGVYYARVCEYLGSKCGVYSNQVEVAMESEIACTMEYAPVCTVNGRTYSNECIATKQFGEEVAYKAECKKDNDIVKIEEKAELLSQNKLDDILAELQELRNVVKEQQTQIKYLRSLMADMSNVTTAMQNSINSFITYGVDENTKNLGEGERAAVMYSYKSAFGKLPETENELADAVKIANGRWPSIGSEDAEARAKAVFEEIYKRPANVSNNNDLAAIKVMAYGLRQRAENRNLSSEQNGIQIFKSIFGRVPSSTEDWNIMQAITYSGATR